MMKLKLESNIRVIKFFKQEVFDKIIGQENAIISSQCLLTPHLKLKKSTQVPIDAVNSKGFLKANKPNCLTRFLELAKSFDLSDKKKTLVLHTYTLVSKKSSWVITAFEGLFKRGSSLSSSLFPNLNTN